MAAAEAVPFAKTGGLADVLRALPRALTRLGIEVAVLLPAYESIDREQLGIRRAGWSVSVPISDRVVTGTVLHTRVDDAVQVYLIEADVYFGRPGLYGTPAGDYPDNAERFAFFSRAVLAMCERLGPPDILHCHDWHTALVPLFLRADAARYPRLAPVHTVLTVHNLGYQGIFGRHEWHLLNLEGQYFAPQWVEFYDQINYLKAGLVSAGALTTVSPTYAREIQTPAFGQGLDGVLRARSHMLTGILNGADYEHWDPQSDPSIPAAYCDRDLTGKSLCKAALQAELGLQAAPSVAILGIVSRLADQKGFDLLAEVVPLLLERPVQLVVLGSGEARYEELLQGLARTHPQQLAVRIAFDEQLAHRIEAGSDIFLMPSRYEPCGLNQMYSLRYGTIPVVHATGGLEDTVELFDPHAGSGNGFKFRTYSASAFLDCIDQALQAYANPSLWRTLVSNAMHADFSWERSARAYVDLYQRQISP